MTIEVKVKMSCNNKKNKNVPKARNAAAFVAKTRNGGFIRHKNERRAKDARNNSFADNW